jgi:plasmid stability protein
MADITLKDLPVDLHAQLKSEAAAHFRSLEEEAMARIQRSFELEQRLNATAVNRLIDEAITSGPEELLNREKFDAARQKARKDFASKPKAT